VSFIVQVATTLVAEVRSPVDDVGRGFVVGGVAGAIVVVLRRSRLPPSRQVLVLSRWTLAGVVAFLLFVLAFR
jgi:hypothetical protein